MLCSKCSAWLRDSESECPICGTLRIPTDQAAKDMLVTFRQGRGDRIMPKEAAVSPVPVEQPGTRRRRAAAHGASRPPEDAVEDNRQDEGVRHYGLADTDLEVRPPRRSANADRPAPSRPPETYRRYNSMDNSAAYHEPEWLRLQRSKEEEDRIAGRHGSHPEPIKKQHMVNWAHMSILAAVLLVMAATGFYAWLRMTTAGQRQCVRWGLEANSVAMWEVGREYLDTGYIGKSIELFEEARELDEEEVDVDNLLMLGSAYEAAGRVDEAEALYVDLYTNIVPTRAEPYTNVIRIMLADGRNQQAADLMLTAYEKTGRTSFRAQRTNLIPSAPEVNIVGGYYTEEKSVVLMNAEGCDVYYTMNDSAILPEEGELYRRPVTLGEGTHNLRAIAVNGDLKSDILTAQYRVYLPAPGIPGCNLAPNTYKLGKRSHYTVSLRVHENNKYDNDITIYYTIDGSTPNADSPVWKGEPIVLPAGRVTLKAIAVNGNGKVSNQLEVGYKFEGKPNQYPLSAYDSDDKIGNLQLYYTSRTDFLKEYGEGLSKEEVTVQGFNDTGLKYTYNWGYAIFARKTNTNWVLVELYMTAGVNGLTLPRGTGLGNTEQDITSKFRDLGQLPGESGSRGLYSTTNGSGKVEVDKEGSRSVHYISNTTDGFYWNLIYELGKGSGCRAVCWRFAKFKN